MSSVAAVSRRRPLRPLHELLEVRAWWIVLGFSVLYWAATWHSASTKPLWTDEILTRYMVSMPLAELVRTLHYGIDTQPPLFYFLTRLSGGGGDPVGLRLPGMVGMWVAALCLYTFVARRTSRVCGLFAMLLLFLLVSVSSLRAQGVKA